MLASPHPEAPMAENRNIFPIQKSGISRLRATFPASFSRFTVYHFYIPSIFPNFTMKVYICTTTAINGIHATNLQNTIDMYNPPIYKYLE